MSIYTKTGDGGETSTATNERVPKDDLLIEAIGTIDELISWLGMCKAQREPYPGASSWKQTHRAQRNLFLVNSILSGSSEAVDIGFPREEIQELERYIDIYEAKMPVLNHFIYPGTTPLSATFHVARSITRRAERRVVSLAKTKEGLGEVIRYLNRLSDFFFVRARMSAYYAGYHDKEWDLEEWKEALNEEKETHKRK